MAESHLYFVKPDEQTTPEVARREVLWLLKDQVDTGWGMSLGGVEPQLDRIDEGLIESDELSEEEASGIEKALTVFADDSECYLASVEGTIDHDALAKRIADSVEIARLSTLEASDSLTDISAVNAFWVDDPLPAFFNNARRTAGAAFNIAHPYRGGPVLDMTDETMYSVSSDGFQKITDDGEGAIFTILSTLSGESTSDIESIATSSLLNRIPKSTDRLAPNRHSKIAPIYTLGDELATRELESSATSGGSILLRVLGDNVAEDEINQAIVTLDEWGFSIAGEYTAMGDRYLLFKLHPRDSRLREIAPAFDPAFERRKLAHTQWARETLPGYRQGIGGDRRTVLAAFDGWNVIIEKPGRKDAEDFIVVIDGSQDDTFRFDIAEDQALFEEIFDEVQRNVKCEQSGNAFAEALKQLYLATMTGDELENTIAELAESLPVHSQPQELRYQSRKAFLWLLGLVFIVEDVNYRFNFHPIERGGPQYRKQGRDQPMNAILRKIATLDSDSKELANQSRDGTLPTPPTSYEGPGHLQRWYNYFEE